MLSPLLLSSFIQTTEISSNLEENWDSGREIQPARGCLRSGQNETVPGGSGGGQQAGPGLVGGSPGSHSCQGLLKMLSEGPSTGWEPQASSHPPGAPQGLTCPSSCAKLPSTHFFQQLASFLSLRQLVGTVLCSSLCLEGCPHKPSQGSLLLSPVSPLPQSLPGCLV